MARPVHQIPAKLKNDAIVEALVELRFDMPTGGLPEIFFVRLAQNPAWKEFEQRMLPTFNIPLVLRESDENLRYQPYFELAAPDKRCTVRIGSQVLSYHRLAPYVGWDKFQIELKDVVDWLFSQISDLTVRRMGLRYMNALRTDLHSIKSVLDLDLALTVADERVSSNVNINFTNTVGGDALCTVRIATPEFIQGPVPPNTSLYVDVDVFTKEGFRSKNHADVIAWINNAHTAEKQHFFRLLTDQTIEELKEK
jgi:uncharacterized protein (TIGR04255 family)